METPENKKEYPPFDPSMLQTADSRFLWNLRKANKLGFAKLKRISGIGYFKLLAIEEDRRPMTDEDREKILTGIKNFNLEKKMKLKDQSAAHALTET